MKRFNCLEKLAPLVGNRVVVTNIGPTCSEWPRVRPGDANLVAAQLGTVTGISLGLAVGLSRAPRPLGVVALDGDGNLLFAPGVLATVAHSAPPSMVIFVFDNGCYESTGGQPSVTQRGTDIEQVAKGFGIKKATTVTTLEEFTEAARVALDTPGPHVVVVRVEPSSGRREFIGSSSPSTVDGIENKFRLARYIEAQTGAQVLHPPEYASGFSPNVGRN
jgi:phosphonopyruvate decarboxylase